MKLQVSQAQAIPGDEPIEGIIEFLEELVNALGVVIGFVCSVFRGGIFLEQNEMADSTKEKN